MLISDIETAAALVAPEGRPPRASTRPHDGWTEYVLRFLSEGEDPPAGTWPELSCRMTGPGEVSLAEGRLADHLASTVAETEARVAANPS